MSLRLSIIALILIATICVAREPYVLPHEKHSLQFGQKVTSEGRYFSARPAELSPVSLSHEVYGFLPYWEYGSYDCSHYNLLSRIAYFNVTLNDYGNVSNYRDWPTSDLITEAHSSGCAVDICIAVFDDDDIGSIVNNSTNRSHACHTICDVMAMGADGVNIDFELPHTGDHPGFYAFMRELTDSVHARDASAWVSLCLPSVDWRNTFDSDSLLPHTNALFLMGYGYYWSGSGSTGPVAPLDDPGCYYDVAYSMDYYCGDDAFKRSRFIVGLPLYGYDWPCTGDYRGASTTGSGSARFYISCADDTLTYGCNYDTNAPAPWYVYGSYHQCWWDDSRSLDEKYLWIVDNDLMGVGYWAIGYDDCDPYFWDGVREVFGDSVVYGDSIIVDDGDPEFSTGGSWIEGSYSGGWWVDYLFCNAGGDEDWATWTPSLPDSGRYDVYMWWNAGSNRCDSVFVRVQGTENDSLFVSQKGSGADWHYLGRHVFDDGSGGYIGISDRTAVNGTVVIADAVLWIFYDEMEIVDSRITPNGIKINVYPNPFNAECLIEIDSRETAESCEIYDISGKLVRRFFGSNRFIIWDGTDNSGEKLPAGIYLIKAGSQTRKTTLLK